MGQLADLRGRLQVVAKDMEALANKSERSADEEAKLDQLLAEFNDLGPKLQREQNIEAATQSAAQMGESRGRVSGVQAQDGGLDQRGGEFRTLAERFTESDAFKAFDKATGRRSTGVDVKSFYHRGAKPEHRDGMNPQEVRSLVSSATLPTSYLQPTYVPGFFRPDDLQGTIRDVLINGQTNSDAITFYRETAFTNAAAPVAEATATTGSTGLKPESALTFDEQTIPVKTIPHWIPITRNVLWDTPQMQTYIEQRLLDGLRLAESDQLLNGNGTGANMTGLLNTSGLQVMDNTPTTGYWATHALPSAGEDRENFDRILHAKTKVRTVGRGRASFVVLNPADVERYVSTVDGQKQYYGAGPFAPGTLPPMWGLRVVEDENLAAGKAVVGDGRMAAVWDRMTAQILIDTIDNQFIRNMLTILAEERLALTVFRPQTFVKVDLAAW